MFLLLFFPFLSDQPFPLFDIVWPSDCFNYSYGAWIIEHNLIMWCVCLSLDGCVCVWFVFVHMHVCVCTLCVLYLCICVCVAGCEVFWAIGLEDAWGTGLHEHGDREGKEQAEAATGPECRRFAWKGRRARGPRLGGKPCQHGEEGKKSGQPCNRSVGWFRPSAHRLCPHTEGSSAEGRFTVGVVVRTGCTPGCVKGRQAVLGQAGEMMGASPRDML